MQKNMIRHHLSNTLKKFHYKRATESYISLYHRILSANPDLSWNKAEEKEWLKHWSVYDKNLSPLCYRVFSNYVGENVDKVTEIIPLEYIASIVEPVLCPAHNRFFYSDKNSFGKIIPQDMMPKVWLRNINGYFFDGDYNPMSESQAQTLIEGLSDFTRKLIVKPSLLDSGVGVQLFVLTDSKFLNLDIELSVEMLNKQYSKDYIVMQCVEQSESLGFFNSTSVNTIRIATYRSADGMVHPLKAGFRIGAKGAVVDNAHGGGVFAGLSDDGSLSPFVCDVNGIKRDVFNDVNFMGGGIKLMVFSVLGNLRLMFRPGYCIVIWLHWILL